MLRKITLMSCLIISALHLGVTAKQSPLSYYNNLPVLVTGGCGFIGSHIVEMLVQCGARVTVLDNLSTGTTDNLVNVANKVQFIQGDINDYDTCLRATRKQAIVFHLAAFISVPESLKNPTQCHHDNIVGTINMLEAARTNNVKRVVFSSSAAVYGPSETICIETQACHPTSPYGYSKYIGELLSTQYCELLSLETVCLRYFNVYGDRQNPHGHYAAVVAKFKERMANNQPITIFGDGLQTRDFIPVEKVAYANLYLGIIKRDWVNGTIVNIATGNSITLLELVDMLKQEFPEWEETITFESERSGDIKHSSADCSQYLALLNLTAR